MRHRRARAGHGSRSRGTPTRRAPSRRPRVGSSPTTCPAPRTDEELGEGPEEGGHAQGQDDRHHPCSNTSPRTTTSPRASRRSSRRPASRSRRRSPSRAPGWQACEQNEVGAERLQTNGGRRGVLADGTRSRTRRSSPLPTASGTPRSGLASDYEFQVYDTTARAHGGLEGGLTTAPSASPRPWRSTSPTGARTECNQQFTDETGIETEEPLTDAWQDIGTMCSMVGRIVEAADAAEAAGGLTQASFIDAYEKLTLAGGQTARAPGDRRSATGTTRTSSTRSAPTARAGSRSRDSVGLDQKKR